MECSLMYSLNATKPVPPSGNFKHLVGAITKYIAVPRLGASLPSQCTVCCEQFPRKISPNIHFHNAQLLILLLAN